MKYLVAITLLLVVKVALAQNLVPNPSFEMHTQCPWGFSQLDFASNWWSVNGTPDYYNMCATGSIVTIPTNQYGYQTPYDGTAYAGLLEYEVGSSWREAIGCALIDSVRPPHSYTINIKVSRAENAGSMSKIGLVFSNTLYDANNVLPINNYADYYVTTVVSNASAWTGLSWTFVPTTAYKYLYIGCFFDNTNIQVAPAAASDAYYYLDKVEVCLDGNCAEIHGDVLDLENNVPSIFPTISHQAVNITFPQGSSSFNIFSAIGQSVYYGNATSLHQAVDVSRFSEGIYFVRVQTHQGVQTAKFVVQR
jgi:hypothetical protein